jgi:hypothetical protein
VGEKVRGIVKPEPFGIRSPQTASLLVVAAMLTWTASAQAYVDPGSGSMLVQLLLGGFAGIAVAIRVYWRRIVSRFRSKPPELK